METKVFDPADGFAPLTDVGEATDPTVFRRGDRWWMSVATQVANRPGVQLATASLPDRKDLRLLPSSGHIVRFNRPGDLRAQATEIPHFNV